MAKMSRSALKTMLAAEKASALAAMQSSKLSADRSDALAYYNNDMSKDMPSEDGRSSAVSSDVADTIEGSMPAFMEIFAGSEEVVAFNPVGPEDVEGAEQETDYINHVFMNQNQGFLVLYSMIKDALLSKVGVVKIWWEVREQEENEIYYELTDDQFAVIASDEDVEITEHTVKPVDNPALLQALMANIPPDQPMKPPQLHDVKVTKSKKFAEAKVLGVPPEEFGIEKSARSIRDCNYCFHRVLKTQSELLAQGFDEKQIEALPTYMAITNTEEINRDTVFEHQNVGEDENKATRRVEIIEHYVRMDYEGKGKSCLYRVTTGGEQGEILSREGEDDVLEFDVIPFAAMTPVIITHRFFGRSIADLIMDIQRIKTALLRGGLDSLYIHNNPRVIVSEQHSTDTTLDDLLVSRPNQIVRVKAPGGIEYQESPMVTDAVFPALEYFDQVRETRTGVAKQGQPLDSNALLNQSATAANQMFTMAQARMRLIARIFAETGIKDLFTLLHATIRKHGQQAQTVRLRNQWVNVDPRQWKKRDDMTVHVGLGTGGKAEQMAMANMIIAMQEKALQGGLTNLVTPTNLYNSAKMLTRITGHKDVDAFFSDPKTQPAPQAPPDPKIVAMQMQAQLQDKKQQTDAAHQQAKMQADAALEQQKFEHDRQMALLEAQLKSAETNHTMQLNQRKAELDAHVALQKLEIQKATATHSAAIKQHESEMADKPEKPDHMAELVSNLAQQHSETTKVLHAALKHMTAPRKIVRDKNNKAVGVETVLQ